MSLPNKLVAAAAQRCIVCNADISNDAGAKYHQCSSCVNNQAWDLVAELYDGTRQAPDKL